MLAHDDALPLAVERAGEPPWLEALARPGQGGGDVSEIDRTEIGRDASALHGGTVVVASAWLAFYVVAAIHQFIASGN